LNGASCGTLHAPFPGDRTAANERPWELWQREYRVDRRAAVASISRFVASVPELVRTTLAFSIHDSRASFSASSTWCGAGQGGGVHDCVSRLALTAARKSGTS